MLALPQWFHELATLLTLVVAGGWLVAQWVRVARPRELGCARCERNPSPVTAPASGGRRSAQLRVLR